MQHHYLGQGSASGKIILMGEHAVVHQQAAIALPFEAVGVTATVSSSTQGISFASDYYQGPLDLMPPALAGLARLIPSTLDRLGQSSPNLHIDIQSSIPGERGMGSSAAVANAIVSALYQAYSVPLSPQDRWDLVQGAERVSHGNPSGIDCLTTAASGPLVYQKDRGFREITWLHPGWLVVADTGIRGKTSLAVTHIQDQLKGPKAEVYQDHIQAIGRLTQQAIPILEQGLAQDLGPLLSKNHYYLQELGVSHPQLDHLVDRALEAGALGAKMTGGGLGGCMLAYASNQEHAHQLQALLQEAGAIQTWAYALRPKELLS